MIKNLFLEIKDKSGPRLTYVGSSLRTQTHSCICN